LSDNTIFTSKFYIHFRILGKNKKIKKTCSIHGLFSFYLDIIFFGSYGYHMYAKYLNFLVEGAATLGSTIGTIGRARRWSVSLAISNTIIGYTYE
jgi:hypothetical protein